MRFTVDPLTIGQYNTAWANYTEYTVSEGNIEITPQIAAEAKAIVGNVTNPYLQAKLLYDYVIGNITYSYMPHVTLSSLGEPESVLSL